MDIYEAEYWHLKHRSDAKLPGYLILAAKTMQAESLSSLSKDSLRELGLLQAKATEALEALDARLVYICRWGHQSGNNVHFHIVPLYEWVEKAYIHDPHWVNIEPDGPVYFTYITRAFIEYPVHPLIEGPSVEETVQRLRNFFDNGSV